MARSTPHDLYLEKLEWVLRESDHTEDEIARVMRSVGVAWETLFRNRLVESSIDPTQWEAEALAHLFDGCRNALYSHPAHQQPARPLNTNPRLFLIDGDG